MRRWPHISFLLGHFLFPSPPNLFAAVLRGGGGAEAAAAQQEVHRSPTRASSPSRLRCRNALMATSSRVGGCHRAKRTPPLELLLLLARRYHRFHRVRGCKSDLAVVVLWQPNTVSSLRPTDSRARNRRGTSPLFRGLCGAPHVQRWPRHGASACQ